MWWNLSRNASVAPSQQIPIYDTTNGQPRFVSVNEFTEYLQTALTSDASGPFRLASYSVAELPSALANAAAVVYCTNGNSGSACLAVSNGTNWLRVLLGPAVSPV